MQRFFHHLNFFWAIDKIFFTKHGIDPFQISLLLAIWSGYVLIFEIPSGAIADRWSRKWVMTIGALFHTFSYVIFYLTSGFWGFLLGYLARGTGGFLQSGTREALIYDHLKAHDLHDRYEFYTGGLWIVTTAAFLTASLISGFLADRFTFGAVLFLTIVTNVISTFFTLLMPEAQKQSSTEEVSYFTFLKRAWKKALKNPVLIQAMFYAMTVLAVDGVLDEYDQLYVTALGLPLAGLGIWWGLRMGTEMIAGLVAHKFKRFGSERVLEVVAIITFLLLLLTGFVDSLVMLGVLALCFFFFAIAVILNEGRLQKLIESHERATINSINSFLKESVAIIVGLGYGYVAHMVSPQRAMLVFAGVVGVYVLGRSFIYKSYRDYWVF